MSLVATELHPGAGQLIYSLANKAGMNLTAALCELADNSLDAGAGSIRVRYDRERAEMTIADDGRGTADVEAIVTPYKHISHATTLSGRYGVGGTASQIFLTEGRGAADVASYTDEFESKINADYGEMAATDRFVAHKSQKANSGKPTGTKIVLTGCRDLTSHEIGSARRELSFTFAPALRKGVKIVFQDGPVAREWEPSRVPALVVRKPFEFEVGGVRVHGFVGLTKPKEANPVRGWAVASSHRFIGCFKSPLGARVADLSRVYSEVYLGRGWTNINDLKNGFVEEPYELWDRLAEVSAEVLDRAESEGHVIEFDSSRRIAQAMLDAATGYDRLKERRASPTPVGEPGKEPTGRGGERVNLKKVQPGDRRRRGSLPRRIVFTWSSGMDDLMQQITPGDGVVYVDLNRDHPENQMYKGEAAGPFLARHVLLLAITDAHITPDRYRPIFPEFRSEGIALELAKVLAKIRENQAGTDWQAGPPDESRPSRRNGRAVATGAKP